MSALWLSAAGRVAATGGADGQSPARVSAVLRRGLTGWQPLGGTHPTAAPHDAPAAAEDPAGERAVDTFVHDSLARGQTFCTMRVVNVCMRECLERGIHLARWVAGGAGQLAAQRGYPQVLCIDNGPEFRGTVVAALAAQHGVELVFTAPSKPTHNGYIESFNGKLRDEYLNLQWFVSLTEARDIMEAWREDYNWVRPHSALVQVPTGALCTVVGGEYRTFMMSDSGLGYISIPLRKSAWVTWDVSAGMGRTVWANSARRTS